jgi:hypothetical protein
MQTRSIPEGEPIMMGMFPVVNHPAVMLFNLGASHTFINRTFVMKHEIPIRETKENFFIQSSRGCLCTKKMVHQVPIGWAYFSHVHNNSEGSGYRCDPRYELDLSAWSCNRHFE